MSHKPDRPAYAWAVATMVVILIAGLWPFRVPLNDVKWLEGERGLRFGRHGSILSSSPFPTSDSGEASSGTIELWLKPAQIKGRRTILAFEGSGTSRVPLLVQQNGDKLIVQRPNVDDDGTLRTSEFALDGVLNEDKHVFVTIALGARATTVYKDGVLLRTSEPLGRTTRSFTGRLVLGNSPTGSDSWSGEISGLAIYDRELVATRVLEHYQDWVRNCRPAFLQGDQPAALYLFNEHSGNVVHNQVVSTAELIIPQRYFVLRSAFLSPPWRHYHATWSYWEDVGINIVGFIPFGFYWAAYVSTLRSARNVTAATILLGFLISLLIEVLQAYLPTRDSGMNDLITNTLGTSVGALLHRSCLFRSIMSNRAYYWDRLAP